MKLPGRSLPPLQQTMHVSQVGSDLVLDLLLRPGIQVHGLWAFCADGAQWWALHPPSSGPIGLRAVIDLVETAERLPAFEATIQLFLDVEHDVVVGSAQAGRVARAPLAILSEPSDGVMHARYRMRLGRSAETRIGMLHTVKAGDRQITPYSNKPGFLVLALNRDLAPYAAVHVQRITVRGGVLRLRGQLLTRHGDVEHAELLLKARTTGVEIYGPIDLVADVKRARRSNGHRFYAFSATGDWGQLLERGQPVDDIFDAWITLRTAQVEKPFDVRVGKTRFVARNLTRAGWVQRGDKATVITPYYTFKARKTSFQVDQFEAGTFKYLRRQLRGRHLRRLSRPAKPVWLVGERPNKAQDTGFHFFRYLRQQHPEIDAYYVMDPASPEYGNVAPLGNVLVHRSREHIRAALTAERVLGSHHPDFLYPLRTRRFRRAVGATRVFLQHGVMGTKWMVPNYGKGTSGFEADLFIVSSEREKRLIVSDFGYDPEEVAVTGLSRFDTLFTPDVARRRQILVMPTWRDWLQDGEHFLASEYYERWSQFLHNPRLQEMASRHGFEVVLCLHPNVAANTAFFADAPVRVITQGEIDVQHLLKESAMLVTDYSSVGFDFSFLHRPVAYYQFDRPRFLGSRGSHLDLDDELPGPIAFNANDILHEVENAAGRDFVMEGEFVRRADRMIAHRDQHNCDRIFAEVMAANRRRTRIKDLASGELPTALFRQFRRSKAYFPTMRAMFRVVRLLPADQNRVVFESGVGRQYADSPRYIYEELVRRGSGLKKVWAYPRKIHTSDPNTKAVARLSPGYYWNLARARYWVNNQNFPHYIVRRPDGVYLQTWHGTPLKRMLHDLEAIHGRDDGYADRVTRAARQWSVLASPSPFATSVMRSAFHYDGPVIEQGYPRNDVFFRPDAAKVAADVRRRLGIPADKKVILYAPTFRDDQAVGNRFSFTLPFDLRRFREAMGEDVVLLLRMHVLVRRGLKIPEEYAATVLDVSGYPEIQELFLASDVLVTDYSSVFFDFATLRRPMVFFAYDLESYRDDLRGFYLDYKADLPGPVVTSEDALYETLLSLEQVQQEYSGRYDAFLARFSPMDDGHAASRVVDEVFGPAPKEG